MDFMHPVSTEMEGSNVSMCVCMVSSCTSLHTQISQLYKEAHNLVLSQAFICIKVCKIIVVAQLLDVHKKVQCNHQTTCLVRFRDGTPSSHTCMHTMVEQGNHRISILCIYASVTCLNFNIVMGWLIGGHMQVYEMSVYISSSPAFIDLAVTR